MFSLWICQFDFNLKITQFYAPIKALEILGKSIKAMISKKIHKIQQEEMTIGISVDYSQVYFYYFDTNKIFSSHKENDMKERKEEAFPYSPLSIFNPSNIGLTYNRNDFSIFLLRLSLRLSHVYCCDAVLWQHFVSHGKLDVK
jgi:hypothetical protein